MSVQITVKMDRELMEFFRAAREGGFEDKTDKVLSLAALKIEELAKLYAPVDTGFLRANIISDITQKLIKIIESQAEYSAYVEFGTSKQAPQPYMTPAYIEAMNEIIELLKRTKWGR